MEPVTRFSRGAVAQLYERMQEVKAVSAVDLGNSKEKMKAEGTFAHNFQTDSWRYGSKPL